MVDDTRDRLLDAAGRIFAAKGVEQATIREICGVAGANVAAVNYHFGDKMGLYKEAVKQAHCHHGEQPQFPWTDETPAAQKLEDFIRQLMTMMLDREQPSWHLELMMREMARPSDACVELVRGFIGPMFELLMAIVEPLLPADATESDRQLYAFSIVAQCLLYRYHRPVGRLLVGEQRYQELFDVERLTRHITAFSLGGLHAGRTDRAETRS
ncbi:MAG: CerR family C-terminal domain-containing protein [Pirellulaceae bacterium]